MLDAFRVLGDDVMTAVEGGIPIGRVADADDVARLALYLASDESSYSTGAEFVVDGGMTAGMGGRRDPA
jgi:3alpha(or 20beta)-hydroxysteroid dehydrogenase